MDKHVLGKNIFVVIGQETLIGTHGILKDTDELVKSTVEQNKDENPSKFRNPECIKDKNSRLLFRLYRYAKIVMS